MTDSQSDVSPIWRGVTVTRKLAAWVALAAAASLALVVAIIYYQYPYGLHAPNPLAAPRWVLMWRNWSIVTGLASSLLALPKWQSLVALPSIVFLVIFGMLTAN